MKASYDGLIEERRKTDPVEKNAEGSPYEKRKIYIIVATHKKYWMPQDSIYYPLHVGRKGKSDLGFQGDDTGEEISEKNPYYCELTGLYWAWKNLDADIIGLAHYRRHFSDGRHGRDKRKHVIQRKRVEELMELNPVLLPKKRNYWIETNYSQYAHAHHAVDLDLTRQILEEKYPEYVMAFETVMKRTSGHRFNMLIMRRDILDQYCAWLFDILFTLEERIDISAYTVNDQRIFGFVGERLLDVWLEKNDIFAKDIPYVFLEKQDWIKKISSFLRRKIARKRK